MRYPIFIIISTDLGDAAAVCVGLWRESEWEERL